MELKEILKDALLERFKAECLIKGIKDKIERITEQNTLKRYKHHKFILNGLEFELIGVAAGSYIGGLEIQDIHLRLAFAVSSKNKLPKEKREKLEKAKSDYSRNKYLECNTFKVELWKTFIYEIEIDKALSGDIHLQLL